MQLASQKSLSLDNTANGENISSERRYLPIDVSP